MPAYPHRIRLRGPWDCEPASGLPGRLRFRRRFGYPGRIDSYERVWLTGTGIEGTADLRLNGEMLAEQVTRTFAFEITGRLLARNELVIETEGGSAAGLSGEIAMEVRRTAYLEWVQADPMLAGAELSLHVTGAVGGTAEGSLELYAVVERHNAAYALVSAPQSFALATERVPLPDGGELIHVRIDLVQGAEVWYTIEKEIPISPGPGS
jgi:hypothetical protein